MIVYKYYKPLEAKVKIPNLQRTCIHKLKAGKQKNMSTHWLRAFYT